MRTIWAHSHLPPFKDRPFSLGCWPLDTARGMDLNPVPPKVSETMPKLTFMAEDPRLARCARRDPEPLGPEDRNYCGIFRIWAVSGRSRPLKQNPDTAARAFRTRIFRRITGDK